MNFIHCGRGTSNWNPVYSSSPVVLFILKHVMLLVSWFATKTNLPVGSIAKLRGVSPWTLSHLTGCNFPDFWSILKIAIELCPLFEA